MPKSSPSPKRPAHIRKFLAVHHIPENEHALVEQCLSEAVDGFYAEGGYSARWWSDAELLKYPVLLGHAAVAALRHPHLSPPTKHRLINAALQNANPMLERHVPYGLLPMLSFLSQFGLTESQFVALMNLVAMTRDWYKDWLRKEIRQLYHWLLADAPFSAADRVWWLWYLLAHCDQPALGYALVEECFTHPAWPVEEKRELAFALLHGKMTRPAPAHWRLAQALFQGDEAAAQQALQELPAEERQTLAAAFTTALPAAPARGRDDNMGPSFGFIRYMLAGDNVFQPLYLQKAGLLALPKLGEDPRTLCEMYFMERGNQFPADAINTGIVEILRAYQTQIPEEALRALIERGLGVGLVNTRKAFYQLGGDLYGAEYWARAAQDNARSIREWVMRPPTAPRRRAKKP